MAKNDDAVGCVIIALIVAAAVAGFLHITKKDPEEKAKTLEQTVQAPLPQTTYGATRHEEDVLEGSKPETYYIINGRRVYESIDGQPIETYFRKK